MISFFAIRIVAVAAVGANINFFAIAVINRVSIVRISLTIIALFVAIIVTTVVGITVIAIKTSTNFVSASYAKSLSSNGELFKIVCMVIPDTDFCVKVLVNPIGIATEAISDIYYAFGVVKIFYGFPKRKIIGSTVKCPSPTSLLIMTKPA